MCIFGAQNGRTEIDYGIKNKEDFVMIKNFKQWLTWADFDQMAGDKKLQWWRRMFRVIIGIKISRKGIFWKSGLSSLEFDTFRWFEKVGKGPDFRWFHFLWFRLCLHGLWVEKE